MLVFITNPKYFDKRKIGRKKVDLVYIFGSKKLFDELSKKYKCVNIGKDGNIKNENFFPEAVKYKKVTRERFMGIKIGALKYFKKKRFKVYRSRYEMFGDYDPLFNMVVAMAKKKRDFNEGANIINAKIISYIEDIIRIEKGEKFLKNYASYLKIVLNLSHSFHRAYIYSKGFQRGFEVFGDVFTFSYFNNAVLYYTFDKFDIYEDRFHFNYLRVLSRLFIEHIHKNEVEKFINHQIDVFKESGWL